MAVDAVELVEETSQMQMIPTAKAKVNINLDLAIAAVQAQCLKTQEECLKVAAVVQACPKETNTTMAECLKAVAKIPQDLTVTKTRLICRLENDGRWLIS